MKEKNLDVVLETPKPVKLLEGSEINLRPLPIMEALEFLDITTGFKVNIISDLLKAEQREKVLKAAELLLKHSDYNGDFKEDKRFGLQTLQDIIDTGYELNLPQSKTPATK